MSQLSRSSSTRDVRADLEHAVVGSGRFRKPPAHGNGDDLLVRQLVERDFHAQLAAHGLDPDIIVLLDAELRRRVDIISAKARY